MSSPTTSKPMKDLEALNTAEKPPTVTSEPKPDAPTVTALGLKILAGLAFQNCFKNLVMRYVMQDKPDFLTSAAVIGVETVKLVLCVAYILFVDRRPLSSIFTFMKEDYKNSFLLTIPAAAYSFQMSMEYVALANLNAAVFSVLVQCKLLFTASFSFAILGKRLKYMQIISLVLLTTGVMLINVNNVKSSSEEEQGDIMTGIIATVSIAVSSGFASVYTEKVIKAQRNVNLVRQNYSLAYMQVQLALVSLVILGVYAMIIDYQKIMTLGLWHNFTNGAAFSVVNSAVGGLLVAAVLKYADSVLKGYATAISVVMTGVLSRILFNVELNAIYGLGIVNVVCAVMLYNGKNLDRYACGGAKQ